MSIKRSIVLTSTNNATGSIIMARANSCLNAASDLNANFRPCIENPVALTIRLIP